MPHSYFTPTSFYAFDSAEKHQDGSSASYGLGLESAPGKSSSYKAFLADSLKNFDKKEGGGGPILGFDNKNVDYQGSSMFGKKLAFEGYAMDKK